MACTTILVGKKATNDGSTMIARNDDGHFDCKKIIVVNPKDQPKKYKSKISHLEIELPDNILLVLVLMIKWEFGLLLVSILKT